MIKIIEKSIDELIPYENNARINDKAVDVVANSIKEFGFKNPIIIDKDGVIVAGHTRTLAAKKLGLAKVPCVIADDLTDEQIKAFRIADNSTAQIAVFDLEKLNKELASIDFDMAQFGLEEQLKEIERLENKDDKAINISAKIQIIIDCENEQDCEEKYLKLQELGIECKISTL